MRASSNTSPQEQLDYARPFRRQELRLLRHRADLLAEKTPNLQWRRAYEQLSTALDFVDAVIARSRAHAADRERGVFDEREDGDDE